MRSVVVDSALLEGDPERFQRLVASARKDLAHLSALYPEFDRWFESRVVPGLHAGSRRILLRHVDSQLGGIAILKSGEESKLCCLRVAPALQGTGFGLRLFDDSFDLLGTSRPLLSVAEEQFPQFKRVFDHFGFEFGARYDGLYRPSRTEFSFNGVLVPTQEPRVGARITECH